MKKILIAVMALPLSLLAAEGTLSERVDGLQAQFDRILAKSGIHFSGEFRSQFLSSSLDGDAVGGGKKSESVEFTSVDFDITARPNTALSARAVFRLHQDWRNFFSDVQNPITTRWLSIDGTMPSGMVSYNVGDYRKKLTPLTLWAPDLDFIYEPEIFAESRRYAMAESFVGENDRTLQGVNVEFKAELYPLVKELRADVFGARLSASGTGESGVISPGVAGAPNGEYWDALYDKYLIGANLSAQDVMTPGFGFGVTNVYVFDHQASYGDKNVPVGAALEDSAKLHSNSTNVFAARLGLDTRLFMDDDFMTIGLNGEFALSSDKWYRIVEGVVADTSATGIAINAGLSANFNLGESDEIRFNATYIMNDSSFRNDAAQSPTFIQRRIINNENGLGGLSLMNPFDALYRSVFKYAPSQYFGGPRPYTKNAYINSILSAGQNGQVAGSGKFAYPSVFQMALPGGLATADRMGQVAELNATLLDGGLTIGLKEAFLTTYHDYEGIDKPEFLEVVAGASVDVAKFVPVVGPKLEIGGSYGMYNATYGDAEHTNDLITAFMNWTFMPRFTLLFGYQYLMSAAPEQVFGSIGDGQSVVTKYDYTFGNLSFGLNYKVADGGFITFKLSMLSGDLEGSRTVYTEDLMSGSGVIEERFTDKLGYTALQPEVFLSVRF